MAGAFIDVENARVSRFHHAAFWVTTKYRRLDILQNAAIMPCNHRHELPLATLLLFSFFSLSLFSSLSLPSFLSPFSLLSLLFPSFPLLLSFSPVFSAFEAAFLISLALDLFPNGQFPVRLSAPVNLLVRPFPLPNRITQSPKQKRVVLRLRPA